MILCDGDHDCRCDACQDKRCPVCDRLYSHDETCPGYFDGSER